MQIVYCATQLPRVVKIKGARQYIYMFKHTTQWKIKGERYYFYTCVNTQHKSWKYDNSLTDYCAK